MAADGPVSPGDAQEIARRIDQLNAKLDTALAANATAKNVTRVVGIVVAAAAVLGVWMIASPLIDAYKDIDKYQSIIQKDLQDNVVPVIEAEVKATLSKAVPALQAVAGETWSAREEEITSKAYNQVETFLTNMTEFGTNEFETRRTRIEAKLIDRLKDEVPELRDEEQAETILANASLAMNLAVERTMNTHFRVHLESVNNIANNLTIIDVPDDLEAMDDLDLRTELTNALGAYATQALRQFLNKDSREFLRTLAAEPNGGTE
jgi:tetrahydromethanopterin S-methyltransferase subunit G